MSNRLSMNKSKIEKIIGKEEEIKGIFYPLKRIPWKRKELIKIPYSIFWTALIIVIYFFQSKIRPSREEPNFITGILLFVGFYAIIGRFIWALFKIMFTVYIVTDKRVIIYSKLFKNRTSYHYDTSFKMTVKANKKDYGYILFGEPMPLFGNRGVNISDNEFTFQNLRKVSRVHELIADCLKKYC
jgi:hypothetical protein